jgi:hypothetical protein
VSEETLRLQKEQGLQGPKKIDATDAAQFEARVGLGRILALCHRSSSIYQIH